MKYTSLLLFIFISMSISIHAQSTILDGYIITNQFDTIYGKIDIGQGTNLHSECKFLNGNKTIQYLPNEIIAYGIKEAQHYSSQKLKGQFVEVLIESQLSLYRMKNNFYIKKGIDSLIMLSNDIQSDASFSNKNEKKRNWKGIVSFYTNDCSKISTNVKTLRFNEKDLVQFVKDYNQCVGSNYIEMKAGIPSVKMNVGLSLSTSFSSLTINTADIPTRTREIKYSSTSPMVGLLFEFSFPRTAQRFILATELNYTKLNYDRSILDKFSSFEVLTQNKGSHSELSMTLIAKYLVWRGKVSTYIHLGLNTLLLLNKSYATTTTEIISPELQYVKKDNNPLLSEQYGLGFLLGINIQKMIGKSSIGFFARTGVNNLLATDKVDINSEEYTTQLGLRFIL